MNFVNKTCEFRPDLHLLSMVISCMKAAETMARLFDIDQVADCHFETEAESEDGIYNESDSDDSNIMRMRMMHG